MDLDITKFMYNDIGNDILQKMFNEGKEIKKIGDYNDLLKLPLNEAIHIEIKDEIIKQKPTDKLKEQ